MIVELYEEIEINGQYREFEIQVDSDIMEVVKVIDLDTNEQYDAIDFEEMVEGGTEILERIENDYLRVDEIVDSQQEKHPAQDPIDDLGLTKAI